jgi:hypothetical protein
MPLPKVFMTQKIQEAGMSILKDKVDITLWSDEGRPDPRTVKRDLPHAEGLIMTMGSLWTGSSLRGPLSSEWLASTR